MPFSELYGLYPSQFISNELVPGIFAVHLQRTSHIVAYTPVCPGSMTGFVYLDNIAIQSFTTVSEGQIYPEDIGINARNKVRFEGSRVYYSTGGIILLWEKPVIGRILLVVSYEYDYENSTLETQSRFTHSSDKNVREKAVWKTDGF